MFGPHLLTSEIQFCVCDELDAHSVTAPIVCRAAQRKDEKTLENENLMHRLFDIFV